jgi:hypothetical protein
MSARYFLLFTFFSLSTPLFSLQLQQLARLFAKRLPEASGRMGARMGAKIGEKIAWSIAARFLGVLSPYLLHIGGLGMMLRESVAKPIGKLSLAGAVGSVFFFLFSLRQLKQKMRDLDQKIEEAELELLRIDKEIDKIKLQIPATSAEPGEESEKQGIDEESIIFYNIRLSILETNKQSVQEVLGALKKKRHDRIKLFFKIASPLSKVMLFALYGGIAYGLQYSGALIEWIGERGIDPSWGGKFVPNVVPK